MATITAQSIIDKARTQLQDTSGAVGVSYLVADLLKYLNEGQREAVKIDLQLNAQRETVQAAEGTKQTLPSDSLGLIRVVRNMGTNGTTPGPTIRTMTRDVLDSIIPDWHDETADDETQFVIYDPAEDRLHYDIFPPAGVVGSAPTYHEIIHGAIPADIVIGDTILDDRLDAPLLDYVLYRAKSTHAEFAGGAGEAAAHLKSFVAFVGAGKGA